MPETGLAPAGAAFSSWLLQGPAQEERLQGFACLAGEIASVLEVSCRRGSPRSRASDVGMARRSEMAPSVRHSL